MIVLALILAIWVSVRITILAVVPEQTGQTLLAEAVSKQAGPVKPASQHAAPVLKPVPPSAASRPDTLARALVIKPLHGGGRSAFAAAAIPALMRTTRHAAAPWRGSLAAGPSTGPLKNPATGPPERPPPPLSNEASGASALADQNVQPQAPGVARSSFKRWSADGWVLARGGQSAPALASGAAAYGGSQAGAVLRYALAPASPLRPQLYVRVTSALAGGTSREREGALGLALRPLRRLPLAVMGEVRVQSGSGAAKVRPVITAVTELPPVSLPLGTQGEIYGQAGWAGGRGPTAFYDAAAVVEHDLVKPVPGTDVRLGGGLWSGGQRGGVRLDIGPRLELRGALGKPGRQIGVRLAVDWRFRVAGHAEPGSGPAITLSAGF